MCRTLQPSCLGLLLLLLLLFTHSSSSHTPGPARKLLQSNSSSTNSSTNSNTNSNSSSSSSSNDTASQTACPESTCTAPPCSIWPCLKGWTAQNDYCTCRCKCISPPGFTGLSTENAGFSSSNSSSNSNSNSSSSSSPTPRQAANAALNAEETQLMQPQAPGQQLAGKGTCAKLYQPCTCSAQCCGNLVCGSKLRTPLTPQQQAMEKAAINAAVRQDVDNLPDSNRTVALPNSGSSSVGVSGSPFDASNATGVAGLGGQGAAENASRVPALLRPATAAGNVSGLLGLTQLPGSNSSGGSQGVGLNGGVGSNSSVIDFEGIAAQYVDAGGPSCRPPELVDLYTGVVNYGC